MIKASVLMVEDDLVWARIITRYLEAEGYVVTAVATGREGLDAAQNNSFDLALIDIVLKGEMNGIELAARLQDLPVIYLSAHIDPDFMERACATHPFQYLVKPFTAIELMLTMDLALYHHQVQQQLQESERRFHRLAENARDVIYRYGVSPPRFEYVNNIVSTITGYTPAEFYDNPELTRQLIHPDDQELWSRILHSPDQAVKNFSLRWLHKEGNVIWTEHRVAPIYDETETMIACEGIARDVTARKRAEEAMQRTQKLESLGVLASGVAHDFNNLLTGMKIKLSLLNHRLPSDHESRQELEEVMDIIKQASHLTNQLLTYSGKRKIKTEPLDLGTILEEQEALLQVAISDRVTLSYRPAPDLPFILADPSNMQQLIMNLVTNAAESYEQSAGVVYVETGVQTVTQHDVDTRLEFSHLVPGRHVTLQVRDEGGGIDAATLKNIFDPFYTTKLDGRGLGLAVVKGIVQSHGGAVTVTSRAGEGAAFTLFFPITHQRPQTEPAPTQSAQSETASGRILLIEDNKVICKATSDFLTHSGFSVLTAANGRIGLDRFQQHIDEIDLVVLDLTMPVMSGEETFRHLRRLRPKIPILIISGYSEENVGKALQALPNTHFLKKPFDIFRFLTCVRDML